MFGDTIHAMETQSTPRAPVAKNKPTVATDAFLRVTQQTQSPEKVVPPWACLCKSVRSQGRLRKEVLARSEGYDAMGCGTLRTAPALSPAASQSTPLPPSIPPGPTALSGCPSPIRS